MTGKSSSIIVRRQVLSYSLRGLFVLFIVVSVPLAIVSQRAQRQRAAVRILRGEGARVYYDYQISRNSIVPDASPPGPSWLRTWLGIDYVARVHMVVLNERRSADWTALFNRLAELPDLRFLDVSTCDTAPEDYRLLDRLTSLETLRFNDSLFDDQGLAIVAKMPKLRVLHLSNTRIRGPGLRHLAEAHSLEVLTLDGSRIEDDLIEFPNNLLALHALNLAGANVQGGALAPLKHWRRLESLSLVDCPLDERAFENLRQCQSIRQLDLQGANVNDAMLAKLAPLVGLIELNLSNNDVTDAGLAALANLRQLERLDLSNTAVAGPGLAHLAPISTLNNLTLDNTLVDDAGAAWIERLAAVKWLSLNNNSITVAGLPHVARMPALERLLFQMHDSRGAAAFKQFNDIMAWDLAVAALAPDEGLSLAQRVVHIATRIRKSDGDAVAKCEEIDRLLQCLHDSAPETKNALCKLLASSVEESRHSLKSIAFRTPIRSVKPVRSLPLKRWWFEFRPLVLRQRLVERIVARSRYGLSLPSLDFRLPARAFSAEELQRLLAPHWRGLPHERFLAGLVGRYPDPIDLAVLEVAGNPGTAAWQALVDALPRAQTINALSAWQQSDPDNAAAWFGGGSFPGERTESDWIELFETVEAGIACPTISYVPEPPFSDAAVLTEAAEIAENAKVSGPIKFSLGDWSNPWQWQGAWGLLESLLDRLWDESIWRNSNGRTAEAARCREAIERITRKFIAAPPHELGTVLQGCRLFRFTVLSLAPGDEAPRDRRVRGRLRFAACYRLAKSLTSLACDADRGPPVDKPMMAAWMAGLDHCTDPRAIAMKRAIDEWAILDEQLLAATDEALPAIYLKEWGKPLPRDPSGNADLEAIYASYSIDKLAARKPDSE